MTLPNFLVIGAGRSGTTSLHFYLDQHPDIFMSRMKSPNFFVSGDPMPPWEGPRLRQMARHWVTSREGYEALFAGTRGETAIGEISPVYLQARKVPERIRTLCPQARLIAILRQPVDRAYSHFLGRRRDGLEDRAEFRIAVEQELSRPLPDDVAFGSYLGCSRYHHFLEGYFRLFPKEQIRIYLFEELVEEPRELLSDLFDFLGVDPSWSPDTGEIHNPTGVIRNPFLRFLWTRSVGLRTGLRPYLPLYMRRFAFRALAPQLGKPLLDPALREQLIDVFRADLARLEDLLDRDLSHWYR